MRTAYALPYARASNASLIGERQTVPDSLLVLQDHGASAEDPSTLTGDWGGLRTQLFDRGINLTTIYTSELANDPRGGDEEKTAYADEWAFAVGFDLQRLLGWNGGHFQMRRHGRDGAYISFEQQINGVASKSGATLFLNITQADRETSPSTDRQIAFGVQYKGPFTTRPSDVLGLALGTTHVNSRVAAGERLLSEVNGSNVPVQGSEYVAEVFYGWTPWPFVTLRPNLQYVVHPGGSNIYANGVVVGLKTTVKF